MVHRLLIVGMFTVWGTACGTEPADNRHPNIADAPNSGARSEPSSADLRQGNRLSRFGQGINKVYGIKIPTGMVPAKGPERVVRFQGKPSVAQVVHSVKSQVRFEKEVREGDGYLFRSALVHKDQIKRKLAIRVFKTGDATTLDIWKEHEYVDALPGTAAETHHRQPSTITRKTATDDNFLKNRRERLADTVRILQKIERREPLTDEERQSSLFN